MKSRTNLHISVIFESNGKIPVYCRTFVFLDNSLSGSLDPKQSGSDYSFSPTDTRYRGKTSQYLDSKGFGWLMEVDNDDDDMQKPIL